MRRLPALFFTGLTLLILFALYLKSRPAAQKSQPSTPPPAAILPFFPTPTPVPDKPFVSYTVPKLPKKKAYTIVLLGDSMTAALGPYADRLRADLKVNYPNMDLIVMNESAPASNVQSLQDRLLTRATESNVAYDPVLGKPFDIIVIESFAYNPLSYLGRTEGLNKANESLTNAMRILLDNRPDAYVVFLATIAPSYTDYGIGAVKLNATQRRDWASERALYLVNHIQFAQMHNIPLVDVYHKTIDSKGNGILYYINPADHIHPSQAGVELIQDELAKYFVNAKTFEP